MNFCDKCGKAIPNGITVCQDCTCSAKYETYPVKSDVQKNAKRSQIFGILSILLFSPFAIPAIIFAIKSKNETDGVMCKKARVGFSLGIFSLFWWGLSILRYIALYFF